MRQNFFFLIFFWSCTLFAGDDFSLVFIHMGEKAPPFAEIALYQTRLFNPDCPIYFLTDESVIREKQEWEEKFQIRFVNYHTFRPHRYHKIFFRRLRSGKELKDLSPMLATVLCSMERFFLLEEFMRTYRLGDVIQIETDNMIYVDFRDIIDEMKNCYKGIGVPFDSYQRAIAGVMYIAERKNLQQLLHIIMKDCSTTHQDFMAFGTYLENHGPIDTLPVLMPGYAEEKKLSFFSRHAEHFNSLFDAAAVGQYLGGTPHGDAPGFINPDAVYNVGEWKLFWELDACGRKVPYVQYRRHVYRMNNLHIHSKNLSPFLSKEIEY